MGGIIGAIIVLVVLYFVVVLTYKVLFLIGFNATVFVDNTIRLHSSMNPVVAWALAGALLGACAGIWYAASRYRFDRVKPLILTGIFVIGAVLMLVNEPGQFSKPHPQQLEADAARARAANERRKWEAEHARYIKVSGGANVRSGPSTQSGRLATLRTGAVVYEVSRQSGWTQVEFRNNSGSTSRGWVRSDLLGVSAANGAQ